jgi:hypothetical protein
MLRPTFFKFKFYLFFHGQWWRFIALEIRSRISTFIRKVMGCPPAISNQSKSELRGTCVAFLFPFYHGKDGFVRHQKEKSKSREMYNNNKATRTTAIKVFSLFCPPRLHGRFKHRRRLTSSSGRYNSTITATDCTCACVLLRSCFGFVVFLGPKTRKRKERVNNRLCRPSWNVE